MEENLANLKQELRKQILTARTVEQAAKTSDLIAKQLVELCESKKATRIGCYLSFGKEPDTRVFLQAASKLGFDLYCPRILAEDEMEFAQYQSSLVPTALGFDEPTGDPIDSKDLDLLIIPALAIDQSGARLGRGGGYFDRYLVSFEGLVGAVVFGNEIIESIPVEPHDKPVNFVITPEQTVAF
jgi:5-formyltetrahydrofolate cyclo-ligase